MGIHPTRVLLDGSQASGTTHEGSDIDLIVISGEVLLEEFIEPLGLSQNRLAIDIGVDARRINELVLGKRAITADTALRLSRFFGNSPQF